MRVAIWFRLREEAAADGRNAPPCRHSAPIFVLLKAAVRQIAALVHSGNHALDWLLEGEPPQFFSGSMAILQNLIRHLNAASKNAALNWRHDAER